MRLCIQEYPKVRNDPSIQPMANQPSDPLPDLRLGIFVQWALGVKKVEKSSSKFKLSCDGARVRIPMAEPLFTRKDNELVLTEAFTIFWMINNY
jgi:hypothetical protein